MKFFVDSDRVTDSHPVTTPRELLQAGKIEQALRLLLPNTKAVELLAQLSSAQKELDMGKIDYKDFEKVQNRIITAARKLT